MLRAALGVVNGTMRAVRVGGMSDTPATPRRRGAVRTEELLRATLDLAAEVGYAGLSIEAVGRRAGVGKHTIYRRWPSKAALLLDALSHVWTRDLDYRDTGNIPKGSARTVPAVELRPLQPADRPHLPRSHRGSAG